MRSYKGLRIKTFPKTKLKIRLILTPDLDISIFIKFVSVPSKPAFENNHILLFFVEGKGFFKRVLCVAANVFEGTGVLELGVPRVQVHLLFFGRKGPCQP